MRPSADAREWWVVAEPGNIVIEPALPKVAHLDEARATFAQRATYSKHAFNEAGVGNLPHRSGCAAFSAWQDPVLDEKPSARHFI